MIELFVFVLFIMRVFKMFLRIVDLKLKKIVPYNYTV